MNRCRVSLLAASLLMVGIPGAARAQLSSAGDLDPSGRVLAKITATMAEPGSYGRPVSNLSLLIVAEGGDRVGARTSDAGVATSWLKPGVYRFVTPDPVVWQGNAYTWDLVIPVRPGMGVIKLSPENATKVTPVISPSATAIGQPEPDAPRNAQANVQTRRHGSFNIGFGYGALTCKDCSDYESGVSGGLSVGWTISPRFSVGAGTTGWYKSKSGVTLTAGTLDARVRFYPSSTGGFFLTGGLGLGSISLDIADLGKGTQTGIGAMLGLGMDVRVSNNVSLTPFWNGFAVQTSDADASVGQIGLGITIH